MPAGHTNTLFLLAMARDRGTVVLDRISADGQPVLKTRPRSERRAAGASFFVESDWGLEMVLGGAASEERKERNLGNATL